MDNDKERKKFFPYSQIKPKPLYAIDSPKPFPAEEQTRLVQSIKRRERANLAVIGSVELIVIGACLVATKNPAGIIIFAGGMTYPLGEVGFKWIADRYRKGRTQSIVPGK